MHARAPWRPPALSRLALGTAPLGNLYRATTDEAAAAAIARAWDAGVRYFDTAPHYGLGLAERRVGAALAAYPRDEYVLSTKVGRILEPSPETADEQDPHGFAVPARSRRRFDFSRDGILRSFEESLERLGLDRVDVLYLHDPDAPEHREQAFGEGIETLLELREQGVVRAVGAGMNAAAPLTELIRRADVDVVLCAGRYTLLDQRAADELLPLALERGVGVVAAGVYNSGLLASPRPTTDAHFDYGTAPAELVAQANRIADVCERHGVSLPEAAVAFSAAHPAVVAVLIGCRDAAEVDAAIARTSAQLPTALWDELGADGLVRRPGRKDSR